MAKIRLRLLFVMLIILLIGLYIKYEKYIPTQNLDIPVTALSPQQVQTIRDETPITLVKVYKKNRTLQLFHQQQLIRTYPIRLGFNPIGHKEKEGDGKTPEGRYTVDWRNAQSQFYKSLHISYPNQQDRLSAQQQGVSPGGDIMIHGSASKLQLELTPRLMSYLPQKDWTLGCIAVRNVDIDEIWQLVDNHTVIDIYP